MNITLDFSLGMNVSSTPEAISPQWAALIDNAEYSPRDNSLRTAPGQRLLFETDDRITSLFVTPDESVVLFSVVRNNRQYLYRTNITFSTQTSIGTLSGTRTPDFALYTDSNSKQSILIASGGLQLFDPSSNTLETLPIDADIVFTRESRIVAIMTGTNRVNYSAIGDPRSYYEEKALNQLDSSKSVLRHRYAYSALQQDGTSIHYESIFSYTYDGTDVELPSNFYDISPDDQDYEKTLEEYYKQDPSIPYAPPAPFELALVTTKAYDDDNNLLYETSQNYESSPTNDPSTGQYLDVGGGSQIVDVDFLVDKIIVYKEDGSVYAITGEPESQTFTCKPISKNAFASQHSTAHVDAKAFFLGRRGLFSFTPTAAYGDITPNEEGLPINSQLTSKKDYALFLSTSRSQLYVKADNLLFVYHYKPRSNGIGAYTRLSLPYPLVSILDTTQGNVFFVYENYIALLDEEYPNFDTNHESVPIQATIKSFMQIAQKHSILIMNRLLVAKPYTDGSITLTLGKKTKEIPVKSSLVLLKNAEDTPAEDTPYEPVNDANMILDDENRDIVRSYRVGGGSNKLVQAVIILNGIISLRYLSYEYLEV